MRTTLLILLMFSGTVFAQEQPSFFDFLKGLGKTDCEAYLDNGDALINASNKAANADQWDEAFYYDDQAFHTYLKAYGHCDEEPENRDKVRERLDQSKLHGNQLACFYHLKEAASADKRASLAVDHLKSASIALKHVQHALTILSQDAKRFCSFDPSLSSEVEMFTENVTTKIGKLEAYIAEHGDDSITVPDVPDIP